MKSCALMGTGQQMIVCAEAWLARGHHIVGVMSDCPEVSAWAPKWGILRAGTTEDPREFLSRSPFDYLFSIVNHTIVAPEVIALAQRGAINYHDSPLPAYAGFNATAWAILEGQQEHAISWHEMTADVDGGRILLQVPVAIAPDDTAFTLAAKCSNAGVRSFSTLLDLLDRPEWPRIERNRVARSFHHRSERPGAGVLDVRRSAAELERFVRALDFGADDNWMCRAKLPTHTGSYLVVGEAELRASQSAPVAPGTLLELGDDSIEIAVGDGRLWLGQLATLEGTALAGAMLQEQLGVVQGQQLPPPDSAILAAADELDKRVTRNERFWVERLAGLEAAQLGDLRAHSGERRIERQERVWPASGAASEERQQRLLAAFALYLGRIGNRAEGFDVALDRGLVGPALSSLYREIVPCRLRPAQAATTEELLRAIGEELALQKKRGTYARDLLQRYKRLRGQSEASRQLEIAVRLLPAVTAPATTPASLPPGVLLALEIPATGEHYAWIYDTQALRAESAALLFERIDRLFSAICAQPDAPLDELPITTPAERGLLLETWQKTARGFEHDRCVHELFEAQVALTPTKVAAVFREQRLSYAELDRRANALAELLRTRGVGPDVLVGLCVERSLEMVVALLGIHKAGGAYVPLDPVYPKERLAIMLEDSQARVLVTTRALAGQLPSHQAEVVYVDDPEIRKGANRPPDSGVRPEHLAYVIFTSGSTGRPKGVMIEHRNVSNFFAGMDDCIGPEPGVWLAVTSISFDISVLELFWTLCRGFEVVIQEESDRRSLSAAAHPRSLAASNTPMGFGLFYFAADSTHAATRDAYRIMLEGAKFADAHGFDAVWTPERHFHAFGGLYPNPAVTTAALAVITQRIELRAGSVVLPLHNPIRVAEDWAVVDNLSGGRVGLSFASGWHVNDFALMPESYARRREVMFESIEIVLKLWRGEQITVMNGEGKPIEIRVLPRPIRERPPLWIASAGSIDTFKAAGSAGCNVLTNMLGQDLADLNNKFAAYREARRAAGHAGPGIISVMLHTFVSDSDDEAREIARKPFCDYLASSYDLVKVAPWMFPAFKQPSKGGKSEGGFDPSSFDDADKAALLEHAFERYYETAGLFGTPERALGLVEQLKGIGATEVACLIDFGIDAQRVLDNLVHLDALRRLANPASAGAGVVAESGDDEDYSIAAQLVRRRVTHFQCTPSMARMLVAAGALDALGGVQKLLLGGEALPSDLLDQLSTEVKGEIINMYGPTETTIWSTSSRVHAGQPISIGRPIANTVVRIVDGQRRLLPIGAAGELCIGGAGVARGYLGRADLTAERFVADPYATGERLYRTGDLARFRSDGEIELIGRLDQQVKVNGYRVELGEIESALGRHPQVWQSTVVVRSDDAAPQLVAYLVPQAAGAGGGDTVHDKVHAWQRLWDQAYHAKGEIGPVLDPRFNTAGWLSSYDGAPIAEAAMREWRDFTVRNVLEWRTEARRPQRVLEIGCGTGMILYEVLPHVEHYTAVDVAPRALGLIQNELSPAERAKVKLLNQPGHRLEAVPDRAFDTAVLNSVVQYFPNADYVADVLARASEAIEDGGRILVGDVRSLPHLELFHTMVELQQAPGQRSAAELGEQIDERVALEGELLLAPAFFHALRRRIARISAVEIRCKRGHHANEMTDFRYDVLLHIGPSRAAEPPPVGPLAGSDEIGAIAELLRHKPKALWLVGMQNARLSGIVAVAKRIKKGEPVTAETLREALTAGPPRGIDPEALLALDHDYRVELRGGEGDTFEAAFMRKDAWSGQPWPFPAPPASGALTEYANTPARGMQEEVLVARLRGHLRELLPEYMVPSAFVLLERFPLTPNGKIDKRALPPPRRGGKKAEYATPTEGLEQTIAQVWEDVLGVKRPGRKDNIFDLGASSLLTVEANAKLSALLGRKIPLVKMFRYPTIEALAEALGDGAGVEAKLAQKRSQDRDQRQKASVERRRQARARHG